MKKHILLFMVILTVVLISAGCSHTPAVKSDSEIMNELSSGKYFTEKYARFTIKGIEVTKRQTDIENKSDKVYVTLSVINDDESISGYIDMVLLYELYNDGWILEECDLDFDGANSGSYFRPEKALDLPLDEVSSALNWALGENISDVTIYDNEADLENGTVTCSVTGKEYHTYMTGEIDATLTYQFLNTAGYWDLPFLTVNSYEEDWNISGKFGDGNDLMLGIDGSIDTLSAKYSYYISYDASGLQKKAEAAAESDIFIYKVSDTSLKQVMGDFYKSSYCGDYINIYDFSIKLTGDCTDYYAFDYIAWFRSVGGHRYSRMLFIGKDQLGYYKLRDYEVDEYNRKVVCEVYELLPIE